ncbi:muconolactone Delta-isomerase [Rhodococcus marinonascens]|uniref:muconolactone Delta-isomerase n=1 Tax=Rhodococcus marinonascens TaxID=38311 RepID=UPI0009336B11
MEFLVRINTNLPTDMAAEELEQLSAREGARTSELRAEGILKKLWRVPGRRELVSLWEAQDPTVLHDALASLPLFPWLDIVVEALATHPSERLPRRPSAASTSTQSASEATRCTLDPSPRKPTQVEGEPSIAHRRHVEDCP